MVYTIRPYKPGMAVTQLVKARSFAYKTRARAAAAAIVKAARGYGKPRGWQVKRKRWPNQSARGFMAGNDYKFVDLAAANYQNDTTGSITLIATIPQGTTVNTREGKSAQLTSVRVRGFIESKAATTVAQAACYLVWDRQPNKALAAIADVLVSASSNAFPNRENAQRFVIIKSWRYGFAGNTTAPAAQPTTIPVDDYVKLPRECVTSFTSADTTGVIGDIISGALLFITVGTIAAGTAAAESQLAFRVNFRD